MCAEVSDHFHISRAAYGSDFRAEPFGNLHGECAHTSRCPVHQDRLPRLNASLVAKTLQRGERRDGR